MPSAVSLPVPTLITGGGTGATTAAGARTALQFGTITKLTDQTKVTDTAPAADSTLLFPVLASTKYRFRFWIMVMVESAVPNLKCGLSGPASPTDINWTIRIWNNTIISATAGAWNGYSTGHGTAAGLTDNSIRYLVEIEGLLRNGVNAGNMSFDWAQWTSSADDLTVKAGSYVSWEVTS